MTEEITSKTAIGEIIESCEEAGRILLSYGVHCVGCHVSPFESLEDGFKSHGLGEKEINEAVERINNEIAKSSLNKEETSSSKKTKTKHQLTITDIAAAKLKELCIEHKKFALRIRVLPGGCSGYKYNLELVDKKEDSELEIINKEVKIVINKESLEKIAGAEIDYQDTLQGAGFKINNPHAKESCGCGESFR